MSNALPFESLPDHKRVPCYAHIMPIKGIIWAFLCFVGYCIGIPWEGIVYTFLYRATFAYQMATQLNKEYRKLYEGKCLYHFCAGPFLESIKKTGLRYGKIPTAKEVSGVTLKVQLLDGYQWLTSNPDFTQSWNEGSSLPYDRTEYRLTIMVPKAELFNLHKWTDFKGKNALYDTLSSHGDPENWYVFKGVIIPYWIADVKRQPKAA